MNQYQAAGPRNILGRLVQQWLVHPRLPVIAALLAMALVLPSLAAGWVTDDYFHQFAILAPPASRGLFRSPLEMFKFFDGDPERTRRLIDMGVIPWWTVLNIKGAFWRPLTTLTHLLDYRLWPGSAALMHAQTILWFGGLVAAAAFLYRRFMGLTWVAGAAAILYAIDHTHGMAVGFLANRNAILATFFGVLAILAHDRWRRDRSPLAAIAASAFLLMSLLSAEVGVTTCAYLGAYALTFDRDSWRRRALSVVPYIALVVVWRIAWTKLGYGVSNVGYYVDPIAEPARFAISVLRNAPILLLGQWGTPPSDVSVLLGPRGLKVLWVAAMTFVLLLAIALMPLLRRDRLARFWALGMVLAVVPVCAPFPMDRLLFFVGIGAMGLLAQYLSLAFGGGAGRPAGRVWRATAMPFAYAFIAIHVVASPFSLPLRAALPMGPRQFLDQFLVQAPLDASVERQDLVIVNAPHEVLAGYLPIVRAVNGLPGPAHTRVLGPALCDVTVSRPDMQTLVVRPGIGYIAGIGERLLRDENLPMSLGERVELTGLTIEVTALTADGRPAEAAFRFAVPLESPSLRWMQWRAGRFVPFTPPAVGETVVLRQPSPALWPFRREDAGVPPTTQP